MTTACMVTQNRSEINRPAADSAKTVQKKRNDPFRETYGKGHSFVGHKQTEKTEIYNKRKSVIAIGRCGILPAAAVTCLVSTCLCIG